MAKKKFPAASMASTGEEAGPSALSWMNSDTDQRPCAGRVLAESTVVHRGRKLATAEGRLYAEDGGKLFAHGTTSCLIL